jgi:hypothetical protein
MSVSFLRTPYVRASAELNDFDELLQASPDKSRFLLPLKTGGVRVSERLGHVTFGYGKGAIWSARKGRRPRQQVRP